MLSQGEVTAQIHPPMCGEGHPPPMGLLPSLGAGTGSPTPSSLQGPVLRCSQARDAESKNPRQEQKVKRPTFTKPLEGKNFQLATI